MGMLILGVIAGGLLLWLIVALLWLLNDYRKYKKNHLLLFFVLLSTGNLYGQQSGNTDALVIQAEKSIEPSRTIFGHNIFATKSLSFEPNMNLATPDNYMLGPGDEVIINVWGASENNIRQTISPEGDMIYIPEFVNTVKINGEVMYPNTVLFEEGAKLSYYVNQSGGFGAQALKRHAYVIRLNGTISRLRKSSSKGIEPGCEIIVPSKNKKKGMSSTGLVEMNSSVATLVMMMSTMINLAK